MLYSSSQTSVKPLFRWTDGTFLHTNEALCSPFLCCWGILSVSVPLFVLLSCTYGHLRRPLWPIPFFSIASADRKDNKASWMLELAPYIRRWSHGDLSLCCSCVSQFHFPPCFQNLSRSLEVKVPLIDCHVVSVSKKQPRTYSANG